MTQTQTEPAVATGAAALKARVDAAQAEIDAAVAERDRLNHQIGALHKDQEAARAKYRESPSDQSWAPVAELMASLSRAGEDVKITETRKREAESALEAAQTELAQREVERLELVVPHEVAAVKMLPTIQKFVEVYREAEKLVGQLKHEQAVNQCNCDELTKARRGARIQVPSERPIELAMVRQLVAVALHRADARSLAGWLEPGDPNSPEYAAAAALLESALPGAQ